MTQAQADRINLAPIAFASTSFVSGREMLAALNDDYVPRDSGDRDHGAYGNWPEKNTQWVQYEWPKAVTLNGAAVYWWADGQGILLPAAARISYWDGQAFVPVQGKSPLDVKPNQFNTVDFDTVQTTALRLEIDASDGQSSGVIEWRAFDSGASPAFPPTADAGIDRVVVSHAATYLSGSGRGVKRDDDQPTGKWAKASGPGEVTFENPDALRTSARFDKPGTYELKFTYGLRGLTADDTVRVIVDEQKIVPRLDAVYAVNYQVTSPFWKDRLKNQIVNWIPHCIVENEKPHLKEGGINNLIEAGKKLRGEPSKPHIGYPFSNAWVLNTAEAMCVALTYDAQGDAEILAAQQAFRDKLEQWIPILLAAQEPDGYFQTRYTLATEGERRRNLTPQRWDPRLRGEHEGYIAGYFIEMGIAHHSATHGKDRRLFDAALKLADCWVDNIGPHKRPWFDGHQEMEQALVRLGRYVNDVEPRAADGTGLGRKYIALAKFLLDSRSPGDFYSAHGGEYDQSHAPVTRQYSAVRAAYTYSAMADVAMETGDADYWSATLSVWDNLVNRKLYVTGGIGSGETSEGFGGDYSLPSASAYVESCSSCGLLYMQHKLGLATHNAKYADLYETTLYNAILGDVDLDGQNFTYTNSLDSDEKRYKWHVCPCCVGNIPRVLLMLPTWMYAKSADAVFVNLYAGCTVDVGTVGGVPVSVTQDTNYPWGEAVSLTINPQQPARFMLNLRSPTRDVSELYRSNPRSDGITSVMVNGAQVQTQTNANGYVVLEREWNAGDTVTFRLPLQVQRILPSDKIPATRGKVALRYGPLIYNIESIDQDVEKPIDPMAALTPKWMPELLGGVTTIHGQFIDGSPLVAVPNYARLNRGGRSLVWMNMPADELR